MFLVRRKLGKPGNQTMFPDLFNAENVIFRYEFTSMFQSQSTYPLSKQNPRFVLSKQNMKIYELQIITDDKTSIGI